MELHYKNVILLLQQTRAAGVYLGRMRLNDNPVLAKGQIWRTRAAAIEIMGLNACFIYYKVTKKLGRRWVSAQVSGLQAMADYLKTNRARLTTGRSRR